MITPRFTLSQDENFVVAKIDAPYVKFSEGEMLIQGKEFSFFCKPYLLKLYFSGEVMEDGTESAKYDIDSGCFTIQIPKVTKGEEFSNLDMLTTLITPPAKDAVKASTLIEVLSSDTYDDILGEEEVDWSVDQVIAKEDSTTTVGLSSTDCRYGFNLNYNQVFSKLREESHELLDFTNPDEVPVHERSKLLKQEEIRSFNAEHYFADLEDDEYIQEFIAFDSTLNKDSRNDPSGDGTAKKSIEYTKSEVEELLRLPRKEYMLDSKETKSALLGLVDILFACLYDMRTTLEEGCVESCWTIRKLSSTLSWLVVHNDLKDTLCGCVRRALCYPLYRHWVLAMKVLDDVRLLLSLGRKQIVKCLLHVRDVFNNNEPYHILNDLYITDYCVWIQNVSESALAALSAQIYQFKLSKDAIELDLMSFSESSTDSDDDSCTESDDDSCADSDDESASDDVGCAEVLAANFQNINLESSVPEGRQLISEIVEEEK